MLPDNVTEQYLTERRRLILAEVAFIERLLGLEQPAKKQLSDLRKLLNSRGIELQNRGELLLTLQEWITSRLK